MILGIRADHTLFPIFGSICERCRYSTFGGRKLPRVTYIYQKGNQRTTLHFATAPRSCKSSASTSPLPHSGGKYHHYGLVPVSNISPLICLRPLGWCWLQPLCRFYLLQFQLLLPLLSFMLWLMINALVLFTTQSELVISFPQLRNILY